MLKNQSSWLPQFALTIAMMLWGSSFIVLKYAFDYFPPMLVIWMRMGLASLCFLLMWQRIRQFEYRKGDWRWLALMSIAEPCLYFVLEGMALRYTSAAQAGMITAMLPLMVAVVAFSTLGERVSRLTLVGFAMAIAGAIGLSIGAEQNEHASHPLLGNFLEFLAMICAAVYSVSLKKLSSRYSAASLTALQAFTGTVFFALFLPFIDWPQQWPIHALLSVAYLGICVTLGAYLLYNMAIAWVPVTRAAGFTNLIPVFSLLFAYIFLGETFNPQQIMASLLILAGVIVSQLRAAPQTATAVS